LGRLTITKFKCNTIQKEDALAFRNQLYKSSEKRDQLEYISQYICITTPKNHTGNGEVARLMNVDYMIPTLDGNSVCVCRTLFQAATGIKQRRLQNINKKIYRHQLLMSGDITTSVELTDSEKSQKIQMKIAAKKEEILSLKKGTLGDFSKVIKEQQLNHDHEEEDESYMEELDQPELDFTEEFIQQEEQIADEGTYERVILDLETLEICRVCCENKNDLVSLFEKIEEMDLLPADLIMFLFSSTIEGTDELPKNICQHCLDNLVNACKFKKEWLESQQILDRNTEEFESNCDPRLLTDYEEKLREDCELQKQICYDEAYELPNEIEESESPPEEIVYEECAEEIMETQETQGILNENPPDFTDSDPVQQPNTRKRFAANIKPAKCYLCDCQFETTPEDHFKEKHSTMELKRCKKCTFETQFPWYLFIKFQIYFSVGKE
jgi:hypothetical protein